jgi:hypothetical protein
LSAVSALSIVACGAGQAFARDARFDAIAVSDARGVAAGEAGYGVGQGDTEDQADIGAMHACKTHHNTNCKLLLTYRMCGAYASSANHAGTGTGETAQIARGGALDSCGRATCKVVVADCVNQ